MRSLTRTLCWRLMYSWMSAVKSSPAILMELLDTMPPSEMTAISVVPPPMSTIMLPCGSVTLMPTPIAAAIGSKSRNTSRPPACSAESRTARSSTSVLPLGTPTTMRSEGENRRLPRCTILMSPRSICSAALKSAITPSRSGRMTRILSLVFSYICLASLPTAIIFSVWRSRATTDGSLTTISPPLMMTVLAVPRSMANSCVNEKKFEKMPISMRCDKFFVGWRWYGGRTALCP